MYAGVITNFKDFQLTQPKAETAKTYNLHESENLLDITCTCNIYIIDMLYHVHIFLRNSHFILENKVN